MTSFVEEAYRLFEDAYQFFNSRLFADELPGCLITFQRQPRLMGYVAFKRWVNAEGRTVDELAINPGYFANYPLSSILQTLCHEMVHIWQEYRGSPSRAGYHNTEWADKMRRIGLMPSATGKPGGATVGQTMSDYVIEGGPFERACKELLESGFRLRWYDTVQVPPPKAAAVRRKTASNVVPLLRGEPLAPPAIEANPTYRDFPIDLEGVFKLHEQQLREEQTQRPPTKVQTTKVVNKSNRHKYYCPHCFMQVWGKPSLKVVCGECSEPLVEDD
jgi:hypothetical protein